MSGLAALAVTGCKKQSYKKDMESIRMNQIQTMGSHNSYRTVVSPSIYDFLIDAVATGLMPPDLNPEELDYTHLPMPEQWNMHNVRSIELDIYHDPQGGRFYNRMCNAFVSEPIESNEPKLQQPGFKIIHIPDVDYNTNYLTLKDALYEIKEWSVSHTQHIPLVVMLELKTDTPGDQLSSLGFVTALPMTKAALDSLDGEIKEVFGEELEGVLTPDELRGDHATVEEAVLAGHWPTLNEARNQVVFVMMADDTQKSNYLQAHENLQGRACFFFDEPGSPNAAFVKRDDPISNFENIQQLVGQGYIVRTRADAGSYEARNNDYTMMNKAFESGAQLVSTDYYVPDYRHDTSAVWSDYQVQLPGGGVARPNPVNGADLLESDWREFVGFED